MNQQEHQDPVVSALLQLRRDAVLAEPDQVLEQRLLALAARRPRRVRSGRSWRLWLLALVGLGGLASGASLGVQGLVDWWYAIRVDGQVASGQVSGPGVRQLDFVTTEGCRVRVRVERDLHGARGVRTRVDLYTEGQGQVNLEQNEHLQGSDSGPGWPEECYDESLLEETEALHSWRDGFGRQLTLRLGPDPLGDGSALYLHSAGMPLGLLLRTARVIGSSGLVSIDESAAGELLLELDDGQGWSLALRLGGPADNAESMGVESADGRVEVRVGNH